jgi:hypothetical protein
MDLIGNNEIIKLKTCKTCLIAKPKNKIYWQFDKNRIEPYGSCRVCINQKKRNRRTIDIIGNYGTDSDIKKRLKNYSLSVELIEVERLRLILLDRIKNKNHVIFNGINIECTICNRKKKILLPVSTVRLIKALNIFNEQHKHNGK